MNVGSGERTASLAAGSLLAVLGITRRDVPGLVAAGLGGMLIYRGLSGHCPMYSGLGVDRAHGEESASPADLARRGVHVAQAFTINKSADELYRQWRNFENLPSIMSHLESVRVIDDRRSHWVTKAPKLAGGSVEWDAEITADEPGRRIAWRSLPGGDVDNAGEVRFVAAPGDRGTAIHVTLDYVPPAGRLGHWAAKAFGESADWQVREDLRRFKRMVETGEVPTTEGQPRGTCAGQGKRHGA